MSAQPTLFHEQSSAPPNLLRNSVMLIGSYLVTRLIAFFSIVYMARVLGAGGFGKVSFAQTILVYLTLLTHMGLMTYGTREIARHPDRASSITSRILSARILLTGIALLILVGIVVSFSVEHEVKVLVLLFGVAIIPAALTLDWSLKGIDAMASVGALELFRTVPVLLLLLWFVSGPNSLMVVPVTFLIAAIVTAAASFWMFRRRAGTVIITWDRGFAASALRTSWPLGLAFVLVQVWYLIDVVLLTFFKDEVTVGWYSAAYKSVMFLLGVGGWYFEALFPTMSRLYRSSSQRLQGLLTGTIALSAALAMPIAVGGAILARPIMISLYGQEYGSSAIALQILLFAVAVEIVGMSFGSALMACDRVKPYLLAIGLGALCSVALNLALIPRFGLAGAGFARLTSSAVISVAYACFFRKVIQVSVLRHLLLPFIASVIMGVVVFFVDVHWSMRILIGAAVYILSFAALYAWKGNRAFPSAAWVLINPRGATFDAI